MMSKKKSSVPDPIALFGTWYRAALKAGAADLEAAQAMALATASKKGLVNVRYVLLKAYGDRGFVFHTDSRSLKGSDLAENPHAAVAFYWALLGRQIRITGSVERLSPAESDAYFATRPRKSQIATTASRQSSVICSRQELCAAFKRVEMKYKGRDVPRPASWGGYRIVLQTIEFWQARPWRMHDRLKYSRNKSGGWTLRRLSP